MKTAQVLSFFMILFCRISAQNIELIEIKKYYETKIEIPIVSFIDLPVSSEVNIHLLNKLILEIQDERAKFYSVNDSLYNVTTYGKIPEKSMKWRSWADDTKTKRIEKEFNTKAYSLGFLDLNKNYDVLVTKVIGFEKTYIDLYLFDKNGKLKSLINLFEAKYERNGDPSKFECVLIQSSITKDGIIKLKEDRFNVKTKRDYQLQSDGYFKVISQVSEGEFEL